MLDQVNRLEELPKFEPQNSEIKSFIIKKNTDLLKLEEKTN